MISVSTAATAEADERMPLALRMDSYCWQEEYDDRCVTHSRQRTHQLLTLRTREAQAFGMRHVIGKEDGPADQPKAREAKFGEVGRKNQKRGKLCLA